ncbi:anti-sigma-F factor Fin [Alkalibacillus aidingensis]|uniref:anti-sigma-F factor Fin n=1 Tax=Alkalibacillus aidingensis TaxID=2747607 RepID=UPI0016615150|nr:anti-sigma-F factor Fin [Alkalibacillus aidingensis]
MSVTMKCRHCKQPIGEIEDINRVTQLIEEQQLSTDEINDMLQEDSEGTMTVFLVCEHCEDILTQNPNLFEHDNFIH